MLSGLCPATPYGGAPGRGVAVAPNVAVRRVRPRGCAKLHERGPDAPLNRPRTPAEAAAIAEATSAAVATALASAVDAAVSTAYANAAAAVLLLLLPRRSPRNEGETSLRLGEKREQHRQQKACGALGGNGRLFFLFHDFFYTFPAAFLSLLSLKQYRATQQTQQTHTTTQPKQQQHQRAPLQRRRSVASNFPVLFSGWIGQRFPLF